MARKARDWTVVTERVNNKTDGFLTYKEYLNNANHKNHKDTKIASFYKKEFEDSFILNTIKNCRLKDELNTKGGRKVESYAQGFNFVLPQEIQPTGQEWALICKHIIAKLQTHLECSNKCFYANLHIEKKGNSHINLMVSRCDEGGKLIEKLDKLSTIVESKKAFKEAVKTVLNVEPKDYTIKTDEPQQKKRVKKTGYEYKKKKKKEKQEKFKNSVVLSRMQEIENQRNTIDKKTIDNRQKLS